ncbi:MAG: dihydrofolate synthase/folylpolyglutamate synthase [Halioglobus sp.]|jgi:dihydrofolate synthase/folylpolyglutamate synthase
MNSSSLQLWLERLETIHPREVQLGLDRISEVAQRLKLLPIPQPVVTVAGTNGKGSTVAVLESVLRASGRTTGAFTSPHLVHFNERIQLNGVEAADEEIVAAFEVIDGARGGVTLTYFEFAALAALYIFRERAPDIVILEVGLGGRLDAVNIVDPTVAIVTSIDLDHQDWLGDTLGEIAREKAGILRKDVPVVVADASPPPELIECIEQVGASPVLLLGRDFKVEATKETWRGWLKQSDGTLLALEPRAAGSLLPDNICAALQAALLLKVEFSDEQLEQALAGLVVPGRRQRLCIAGVNYVLDVAHNPASIDKLLEYLDISYCKGKTISVFSIMSDKDAPSMIKALAGRFDGWFLAEQPDNPRAAKAAYLAELLSEAAQDMISISKNLRQAFRRAQSVAAQGDTVVVFGSFFTVAAVLPLLQRDVQKNVQRDAQRDEKKHEVH